MLLKEPFLFLFFKKINLLSCVYVSVCGGLFVPVIAVSTEAERGAGCAELEFPGVLSFQKWALGRELQLSTR